MSNSTLTLRTLTSPYGDTTLGSVLSHADVDNNFIKLKGETISSAETNANTVSLKKLNGDNVSFTSPNIYNTSGVLTSNRVVNLSGRTLTFTQDLIIGQSTLGSGGGFSITNNAFGFQALSNNKNGQDNIAIGNQALYPNFDGNNNIGIGSYTLLLNQNGDNNVAVGKEAIQNMALGNGNVGVGLQAIGGLDSGDGNTAIGFRAGVNHTTGDGNIFIGNNAGGDMVATTNSNMLYIGNNNTLIFGNMGNERVGINTVEPIATLHVKSNGDNPLLLEGLKDESAGKSLVVDNDGIVYTTTNVLAYDEIKVPPTSTNPNSPAGVVTLGTGTGEAYVGNSYVTPNSIIILTKQDNSFPTAQVVVALKNIGEFMIQSSDPNDTSEVAYLIINPTL